MSDVEGEVALPQPLPESWARFVWPTWVPLEVSLPIEQFWSRPDVSGPTSWAEDADRSGSYPLGAVVTVTDAMGSWPGRPSVSVTGRWVHAWRGTGRIILPGGTWTYSYFTSEEVSRWRVRAVADSGTLSGGGPVSPAPPPATPKPAVRRGASPVVERPAPPLVEAQKATPCLVCRVPVAAEYIERTGQSLHKVCAGRVGRAA